MKRKRENQEEDTNTASGPEKQELSQQSQSQHEHVDFFSAIKNDDVDSIKTMLQENPKLINVKDYQGSPPMYIAVLCSSIKTIKALHALYPNLINATDNRGNTLIDYAAIHNSIEVIEILHTLNTNLVNVKDNHGNTAMHHAAMWGNSEVINAIYVLNPELINAKNEFDFEPMHYAAMNNHTEFMYSLYALNRHTIGAVNVNGDTPMHIAALFGRIEAIKVSHALYPDSIKALNIKGYTPMHVAAIKSQIKAMEALHAIDSNLINVGDNIYNHTPMHIAALGSHINVVKWLIEKGAEIDGRSLNRTPLCYAVARNISLTNDQKLELSDEDKLKLLNENKAIIRLLKKEGANIDYVASLAIAMGDVNVFNKALEYGADVDSTYHSHNYLQIAEHFNKANIVKLLENIAPKLFQAAETERLSYRSIDIFADSVESNLKELNKIEAERRKALRLRSPEDDDQEYSSDEYFYLSHDEARIFADAITIDGSIVHISMTNGVFKESSQIKPILDAINSNKSIKSLEIGQCAFEGDALTCLKNFIADNNSIDELELYVNNDAAWTNTAPDISDGLCKNRSISKLEFASPEEKDFIKLFIAMKENRSVNEIKSTWSLNNKQIESVIDLLKDNKNLFSIDYMIDEEDIDLATIEKLVTLMKSHTGMTIIPTIHTELGLGRTDKTIINGRNYSGLYKDDLPKTYRMNEKLLAYQSRNNNYLKKVFEFIHKMHEIDKFNLSIDKFGLYKLYQGVNKNALLYELVKLGSEEFFGANKTIEQKHDYIKSIFKSLDHNIHFNFLKIAAVCTENSLDCYYDTDTAQNKNVDITADSRNNNTNNDAVATNTMAIDLVTSNTKPVMNNTYIPQEIMMAISFFMGDRSLWNIDYGDHFVATNSSKVNESKIVGEVYDI